MVVQRERTYPTPFKRHLSFYDRDGDGLIYFGDSLRANLSLGLDFPVALAGGHRYPVHLWEHGLERKALVASSGAKGFLDRVHVNGLWALAADKQGKLSPEDIRNFQGGKMLFDLEKRRKDRGDVLPLRRGGPISVAGHSWFVEKLFGVKVYQTGISTSTSKKD